jgi:5-hydroxyisourate hydrolase
MVDTNEDLAVGGISIHAVDVARGVPAAGLYLRLQRIEHNPAEIATGSCADNGHFQHSVAEGVGVERGVYEIEFDVGAYYRSCGVTVPNPSFLEVAVFRFGIDRVNEHFHLPFKFTPWGFSLFRGGA